MSCDRAMSSRHPVTGCSVQRTLLILTATVRVSDMSACLSPSPPLSPAALRDLHERYRGTEPVLIAVTLERDARQTAAVAQIGNRRFERSTQLVPYAWGQSVLRSARC